MLQDCCGLSNYPLWSHIPHASKSKVPQTDTGHNLCLFDKHFTRTYMAIWILWDDCPGGAAADDSPATPPTVYTSIYRASVGPLVSPWASQAQRRCRFSKPSRSNGSVQKDPGPKFRHKLGRLEPSFEPQICAGSLQVLLCFHATSICILVGFGFWGLVALS